MREGWRKNYEWVKRWLMLVILIVAAGCVLQPREALSGTGVFGASVFGGVQAQVMKSTKTSGAATPVISNGTGTKAIGAELQLSVSDISLFDDEGEEIAAVSLKTADSDGNVKVQWYRYREDRGYTAIEGAEYSAYTVTYADFGYQLLAVIYTTDAPEAPEGTAAVAAPKDDGVSQIQTKSAAVTSTRLTLSGKTLGTFAQLRYTQGEQVHTFEFGTGTTSYTTGTVEWGGSFAVVQREDVDLGANRLGTVTFSSSDSAEAGFAAQMTGQVVYIHVKGSDIFADSSDSSYSNSYVKLTQLITNEFFSTSTGTTTKSPKVTVASDLIGTTKLAYGSTLSLTIPAEIKINGASAVIGEGGVNCQWYRYRKDNAGEVVEWQLIEDAASASYTVTASDIGYYLAALIYVNPVEGPSAALQAEDTALAGATHCSVMKAGTAEPVGKLALPTTSTLSKLAQVVKLHYTSGGVEGLQELNTATLSADSAYTIADPLDVSDEFSVRLYDPDVALTGIEYYYGKTSANAKQYDGDHPLAAGIYGQSDLYMYIRIRNSNILADTGTDIKLLEKFRVVDAGSFCRTSGAATSSTHTLTGTGVWNEALTVGLRQPSTSTAAANTIMIGAEEVVLPSDGTGGNVEIRWYRYRTVTENEVSSVTRAEEILSAGNCDTYVPEYKDINCHIAAVICVPGESPSSDELNALLLGGDTMIAAGENPRFIVVSMRNRTSGNKAVPKLAFNAANFDMLVNLVYRHAGEEDVALSSAQSQPVTVTAGGGLAYSLKQGIALGWNELGTVTLTTDSKTVSTAFDIAEKEYTIYGNAGTSDIFAAYSSASANYCSLNIRVKPVLSDAFVYTGSASSSAAPVLTMTDLTAGAAVSTPAYGTRLSVSMPDTVRINGEAVSADNACYQWWRYRLNEEGTEVTACEAISGKTSADYVVEEDDLGWRVGVLASIQDTVIGEAAARELLQGANTTLSQQTNSAGSPVRTVKLGTASEVGCVALRADTTNGDDITSGRQLLDKLATLTIGDQAGIEIGGSGTRTFTVNVGETMQMVSKTGLTLGTAVFYFDKKTSSTTTTATEIGLPFDTAGTYSEICVRFTKQDGGLFDTTSGTNKDYAFIPLGITVKVVRSGVFTVDGSAQSVVSLPGTTTSVSYGTAYTMELTNADQLSIGGNTLVLPGEDGANTSVQWYRYKKATATVDGASVTEYSDWEIIPGATGITYTPDVFDVNYYLAAVLKSSAVPDAGTGAVSEEIRTLIQDASANNKLTTANNAPANTKNRIVAVTGKAVSQIVLTSGATGMQITDAQGNTVDETGAMLLARIAALNVGERSGLAIGGGDIVVTAERSDEVQLSLSATWGDSAGTRNLGTHSFYYRSGDTFKALNTNISGLYSEVYVKAASADGSIFKAPTVSNASVYVPLGVSINIIDSEHLVYAGSDAAGAGLSLNVGTGHPAYGQEITVSLPDEIQLAGEPVILPGNEDAAEGFYVQWYRYDGTALTRIPGANSATYVPDVWDINCSLAAVVGRTDYSGDTNLSTTLANKLKKNVYDANALLPQPNPADVDLYVVTEKVSRLELKDGETGRGDETMQELLGRVALLNYGPENGTKQDAVPGSGSRITGQLGDRFHVTANASCTGLGLGGMTVWRWNGSDYEELAAITNDMDDMDELYVRSADDDGIFESSEGQTAEEYYVPLGISVTIPGTLCGTQGASGTLNLYVNGELGTDSTVYRYGDQLRVEMVDLAYRKGEILKTLQLPGDEATEGNELEVKLQWYRAKISNNVYSSVEEIPGAETNCYTVTAFDIGYRVIPVLYTAGNKPSADALTDAYPVASVSDTTSVACQAIRYVPAAAVSQAALANDAYSEGFVDSLMTVSYGEDVFARGTTITASEEQALAVTFCEELSALRTVGTVKLYLVADGKYTEYTEYAAVVPGTYDLGIRVAKGSLSSTPIAVSSGTTVSVDNITLTGVRFQKPLPEGEEALLYSGTGTASLGLSYRDIAGEEISAAEYGGWITLSVPDSIEYRGIPVKDLVGNGIGVSWYRYNKTLSATANYAIHMEGCDDQLSYRVTAADVNYYVAPVIYVESQYGDEEEALLFSKTAQNESISMANNASDKYLLSMKAHTPDKVGMIDLNDEKYGSSIDALYEIANLQYDGVNYTNQDGRNCVQVGVSGMQDAFNKSKLVLSADGSACGENTSLAGSVAFSYSRDGSNFVDSLTDADLEEEAEYGIYVTITTSDTATGKLLKTVTGRIDTGVRLVSAYDTEMNAFMYSKTDTGNAKLVMNGDVEYGSTLTVDAPGTILVNGEACVLPVQGQNADGIVRMQWYRGRKSGTKITDISMLEGAVYQEYAPQVEDVGSYLIALMYIGDTAPTGEEVEAMASGDTALAKASRTSDSEKQVKVMKVSSSTSVPKISLDSEQVSIGTVAAQTYHKNGVRPELSIMVGQGEAARSMVADTEYSIAYTNDESVGVAEVTITGIGSFTGTRTIPYEIAACDITTAAEIAELPDQLVTGTEIQPEPVVTVRVGEGENADEDLLVKDEDYTVTYENNVELGTAAVIVTGIGNYTGSVQTAFDILSKYREEITPAVTMEDYVYGAATPVPSVTGNSGDGELTFTYKEQGAEDSTYQAEPPTEVGAYVVRVQIAKTWEYKAGEAAAQFRILPAEPVIAVQEVTFAYNGSAALPPAVTWNGAAYEGSMQVSYKDRESGDEAYSDTAPVNAGAYTVRVEIPAIGNYLAGSATADLTITKAPITLSVAKGDYIYGETPTGAQVTGNAGNGNVSYEYKEEEADESTYQTEEPQDAGAYSLRVTVEETENYQGGTAETLFVIGKAPIALSVAKEDYICGETPTIAQVTGNAGDGEAVYEYKAYGANDSEYEPVEPSEAGKYVLMVTVAETLNYQGGSAETEFEIIEPEEATTEEATTEEATTEEATTEEATTEKATSEEATTEKATTEEATTEKATSEEATTEKATSEEATTEKATSEEPTTEKATTEESTSEKATTEESTSEKATTEEPVSEEATSETSSSVVPVSEEPITEKGTTERAATESAAPEKATTEKTAPEKATTEKTAPEEPTTERTITEESAIGQATTEKGTADQAATEKGTAGQAATEKGTAGQAATEKETADQAATEGTAADQATTEKSSAGQTATEADSTQTAPAVRKQLQLTVIMEDYVFGKTPSVPEVRGNDGNGTVRITYHRKDVEDSQYDEELFDEDMFEETLRDEAVPPVDAGTYVVSVEVGETDAYEAGKAEAEFRIIPRDLKDADVRLAQDLIQLKDGKPAVQKLERVMLDNIELLKDKDFEISKDSVMQAEEPGIYTVVIRGIGNYQGAASADYEVKGSTQHATEEWREPETEEWRTTEPPIPASEEMTATESRVPDQGTTERRTGREEENTPSSEKPEETGSTEITEKPDTSQKVVAGDLLETEDAVYQVTAIAEDGEVEAAYVPTAQAQKEATVVVEETAVVGGVEMKVTSIADNAFKNNNSVKKVVLAATIEKIGDNAFAGCKNLTTVDLSKTKVEVIGRNAFKGTKITSVKLPRTAQEVKTGAFQNCKNLKTITLGGNVKKVGANAFKGSKKIKTVVFTGSKVPDKKNIKGVKSLGKNVTIKVPKKQFAKYKKVLKAAGFKGKIKKK